MSAHTPQLSPVAALFRVVIAGMVIAVAVGIPSCQVASTMSQGLEVATLVKAAGAAGVSAMISMVLIEGVVRDIWTAWVGLLGGVMPASLAAPPRRLVGVALAHLLGGGLLVVPGFNLLRGGIGFASATWSLFGLCLIVAGLGLGLGGAVPRLWWVWRGCGVAEPDDAVSRHLRVFAWLALAALALSSGLAETLPRLLNPGAAIPLRRGDWERGCVSMPVGTEDICPRAQPFVVHTREAERLRLEWSFSRDCEIVVEDGEGRRSARERGAYLHLDAVPGRPILVTVVGLADDACHYDVRVRPDPEPTS